MAEVHVGSLAVDEGQGQSGHRRTLQRGYMHTNKHLRTGHKESISTYVSNI